MVNLLNVCFLILPVPKYPNNSQMHHQNHNHLDITTTTGRYLKFTEIFTFIIVYVSIKIEF